MKARDNIFAYSVSQIMQQWFSDLKLTTEEQNKIFHIRRIQYIVGLIIETFFPQHLEIPDNIKQLAFSCEEHGDIFRQKIISEMPLHMNTLNKIVYFCTAVSELNQEITQSTNTEMNCAAINVKNEAIKLGQSRMVHINLIQLTNVLKQTKNIIRSRDSNAMECYKKTARYLENYSGLFCVMVALIAIASAYLAVPTAGISIFVGGALVTSMISANIFHENKKYQKIKKGMGALASTAVSPSAI